VKVGGYLDADGNNFWGVEVRVIDGVTYIYASDRDSGLWIFRDTTAEDGNLTRAASAPTWADTLFLPFAIKQ